MRTNNKLREAMLSVKADILKRSSENVWYITVSDIIEKIDAALAAPPRNCDTGVVTEQIKRYEAYCKAHTKPGGCTECPLIQYRRCQIAWAQLPYKEGGMK